jgi:hypothetical protein
MAWKRPCPICSDLAVGPACATCGAEAAKVEETLCAADPVVVVPTLWQLLWRRTGITSPVSETLWEQLSPGFKDALLREYRARQWRARALTSAILFPLVCALLASCFWAGVTASRAFGLGAGKEVEWLCGAGGTLVLLPLRVIPPAAYVERLLLRSSAESGARAVLHRFPLVGMAVLCRCPLPWYLNPDVLFPLVVATVLASGWLLL